jgi:hypothetical protein
MIAFAPVAMLLILTAHAVIRSRSFSVDGGDEVVRARSVN